MTVTAQKTNRYENPARGKRKWLTPSLEKNGEILTLFRIRAAVEHTFSGTSKLVAPYTLWPQGLSLQGPRAKKRAPGRTGSVGEHDGPRPKPRPLGASVPFGKRTSHFVSTLNLRGCLI